MISQDSLGKNKKTSKVNIKYIFAFFILLIVEVIIALFIKDKIIRPYIGDILVVVLIYTLIRGVMQRTVKFLTIYIFLFAILVEIAQYYRIVDILNLQSNKVISTIIGTSFDIKDIFCYLVGTVILIIWERVEKR